MQEQIHTSIPANPHGSEGSENTQVKVPVPQLDALLEQIDTVLNEDAQTMVHGFVQKGGE